ncbi:hypothetical protein LPB86_14770 [Pedobacter sp. MC2016-14]|uniref:hypothetical protein n=1 Tax=Pedobacter sp. MC2016-14 TaxID=2897327 RepID=UPI001E473D0E|nr:hypothetical protein [Pedobacter sp. MC2016-14]MCD0489502.1 hypothetical protein [Pedobacter sp. MC2016-14]
MKNIACALLIFMLVHGAVYAQESALKQNLRQVIATINNRNDSSAIEKLYLQTDKPSYLLGDTLWFKAYLFDATTLNYAAKSGMMYVEIANDSNVLIKRIMMPVYSGLMFGNIAIDQDLPQGDYVLRAYTSWMLNFGLQTIFTRRIYIGSIADQGEPKLKIPLISNRPEQIDLQFMAEGGSFIVAIESHMAFKALNEDGKAAQVSGRIFDSKGREVTRFHSNSLGIGAVNFRPEGNEFYSARMDLPDGSFKTYPLPLVKTSGMTLQVNNPFESDSCEVVISGTPDYILGRSYYLIGLCRGRAYYSASFGLKGGSIKRKIDKKLFPSGIAHFVLMTSDKKVLNERIIYVDHNDHLSIRLTANKLFYGQRDSVLIDLMVADKEGKPLQGNFSLAVTDDGQVKTDSLKGSTIGIEVLLTSNLKGEVESPGYYVGASKNVEKWKNLDLLLLSQGWISYGYEEAFKPAKVLKYSAEPEFVVKGRILNLFNKPVANLGVSLFSKKPMLILDTVTNAAGVFNFKGIFPVDTARFFVQARNKKGKNNVNVAIEMDEFKPPVFTAMMSPSTRWHLNIDTASLMLARHRISLQKEYDRVTGKTNMLNEVVISQKKIVKGSENLNGAGNADQVINQLELDKAGKMNLEELMTKYIKGFMKRPDMVKRADKSGTDHAVGALNYFVNEKQVALVVDGMDIEFWRPEGVTPGDNIKNYLQYFDAEDIIGIEVMTTGKYQVSYSFRFNGGSVTPWNYAFIEVTTRTGKGPLIKKKMGTYLYKPMPFSLPKLFYAPKYHSASKADGSDIRSTIFWEPNIVTDKDGKAQLSFYTADNPGAYTLIIEGADMQGRLGSQQGKLMVKKQ